MNKNTAPKIGYFEETALVLRREGFQVEQTPTGPLKVSWNDEPLCEVGKLAGITYRNENVATPERMAAKDKAYAIVCTTAEYIEQMELSAPVPVKDLEDRYKMLAIFNNTILAGKYGKHGVEFVTWNWHLFPPSVSHGHYYGTNYSDAKQDFAIRTGLVSEQRIFGDEQLIEIYRCCADTLDVGYDLTYDQEKCIKGIQEQIEHGIPDIMDRIEEQDHHTMEPPSHNLTM